MSTISNVVIIAGVGVAAVFLGPSLLDKLGLGKSLSDEEKEAQDKQNIISRNVMSLAEAFDPGYKEKIASKYHLVTANEFDRFINNRYKVSLSAFYQRIRDAAKSIYESAAWYNDDEAKIEASISSLRDKYESSVLAAHFTTVYGQSLYSFLIDTLSTDELNSAARALNGSFLAFTPPVQVKA